MGRADLFHWLPDEEKLLVLLEKVRWVDRPEGISSTKSLLSFSVRVQGRQVCEVTNLEVPSIAEKKGGQIDGCHRGEQLFCQVPAYITPGNVKQKL